MPAANSRLASDLSYALEGLPGGLPYVAAHEARLSLDVRLDDLGAEDPELILEQNIRDLNDQVRR